MPDAEHTAPSVIVLIPAYQEAARIAATVQAARALPGVGRVVVIDDGSADDTAQRAEDAGAEVIRQPVNGGKGAALRAGLAACPGDADDILLLLDADLGATAAEAAKLLVPVCNNEADLAIARFPKATGKAGFGLVKGLARTGTWLLTRNRLDAPISGQRACRRWVLEAAPIADGYGVEVAMNVAAGDAGARIVEVPVEMTHAATGRTLGGFKHRGRQFVHIFGALLASALGNTGGRILPPLNEQRKWWWIFVIFSSAVFSLVISALFFSFTDSLHEEQYGAIYFIAAPIAVCCGPVLSAFFSALFRTRRKNFRGRVIPALGGLLVLPVSLIVLLVSRKLTYYDALSPEDAMFVEANQIGHIAIPLLLIGWMLLGLLDDVAGNAQRKGFKGHIKALLEGKLTTGGVKLLGGGCLAFWMAWYSVGDQYSNWATLLLAALLIALSANMLNLFDLRPGRALKVFWLVVIVLILIIKIIIPDYSPTVLLNYSLLASLLILATFIYAPFDFSGMMMLGDTGSNPLGAFMGLCLVLTMPWYGQAVAVLLLTGLHIYAERASITKLIERTPWLRWVDELGR